MWSHHDMECISLRVALLVVLCQPFASAFIQPTLHQLARDFFLEIFLHAYHLMKHLIIQIIILKICIIVSKINSSITVICVAVSGSLISPV